MKRWFAVAAVVVSALALGPPVMAAGKPSKAARAAVLQAIVDCRPKTDITERLRCYDQAAAKLDEAEATGQVVVVDREQATQVRREVFGLQLPSLDIFGREAKGGAPAEDLDQVTEKVKRASLQGDGRWRIELESGAVWRQTDDNQLGREPKPGSTAEIRKASLGSFFLKIDSQRAFKAHRER